MPKCSNIKIRKWQFVFLTFGLGLAAKKFKIILKCTTQKKANKRISFFPGPENNSSSQPMAKMGLLAFSYK
jgi:hypothetical protein